MQVAYHKGTEMTARKKIRCCLCHESDYHKIYVDELGLAAGMSGDDYSFCKKCWTSKNLGERILRLLGFEHGMKLKPELLEICDE